jgi:hypothetical protein
VCSSDLDLAGAKAAAPDNTGQAAGVAKLDPAVTDDVEQAEALALGAPAPGERSAPLLDLDTLACRSVSYVAVVISVSTDVLIACPASASSAAFGLTAPAGRPAQEMVCDSVETWLPLIAHSPVTVESYLAGELDVDEDSPDSSPIIRIVVTPIPLPVDPDAVESARVAWRSLRDITHTVLYDIALAAAERLRVQRSPSAPMGVPLRVGRGATLSLTRSVVYDGAVAEFDAKLMRAEAQREMLRCELRRRGRDLAEGDPGKSTFYFDCASRTLPIPVSEIPHGLRTECREFDDPQLVTEPYCYHAVIPISDPPPPSAAAPTSWPVGVTPPTCELEFYEPDVFDAALRRLDEFDAWHQSGGALERPQPFACGIEGVRPQFQPFVLAGGVIDWTLEPPAPLDPATDGHVPTIDAAKAAAMFAYSTDKRTTAAWGGVDAPPRHPVVVLLLTPNLLSVYPEGGDGSAAHALATEQDGFDKRGWTRPATRPRSREAGSLGLPNGPFANAPTGIVPKPQGFRVILEMGHPRKTWVLRTGQEIISFNTLHGPSKPHADTPPRLAGDAPMARERKPPVKEGVRNSTILGSGGHASGLPVFEGGMDFFKCFHAWHYSQRLVPYMGSIAPTLDAQQRVHTGLLARRNHRMAMGWLPASKECQFGMNQINCETLRRLSASEDAARAAGLYSESETAWHDARRHLPPTDYGRQDIMATLSTYAVPRHPAARPTPPLDRARKGRALRGRPAGPPEPPPLSPLPPLPSRGGRRTWGGSLWRGHARAARGAHAPLRPGSLPTLRLRSAAGRPTLGGLRRPALLRPRGPLLRRHGSTGPGHAVRGSVEVA